MILDEVCVAGKRIWVSQELGKVVTNPDIAYSDEIGWPLFLVVRSRHLGLMRH